MVKKKYIFYWLVCIFIFIAVVGLYQKMTEWDDLQSRIASGPGMLLSKPWRTYTDPENLFSISLPVSWQVSYEPGKAGGAGYTHNILDYGYTETDVILGSSYTSSHDFINVTIAIDKTTAGLMPCMHPNTMISGFPADYDQDQTWNIHTNKRVYQLQYQFTGKDGTFSHPLNELPSPQPQAFIDANMRVIEKVITSFHPINQTPNTCKQ